MSSRIKYLKLLLLQFQISKIQKIKLMIYSMPQKQIELEIFRLHNDFL